MRDLTNQPKYNYSDARALIELKRPDRLSVLPGWDIRPARNQADIFLSRCWSELIARKEVDKTRDEDVTQAIEKRAEIQAAGYMHDYLVGFRTIPELPSPDLWFAVIRSFNRRQALSLLVEITSGDKSVSELRSLYSTFFDVKENKPSTATDKC